MRNPNGYGTVYKMTGKRRKPWRAVLTDSYEIRDGHAYQKRVTLGYYHTKVEAITALANYHQDPYDLRSQGLTFAEVYEKFTEEKFKEITPSAARGYKSAYSYFKPLYDYPFASLRLNHLESTVDNAPVSVNLKSRMKSMLNLMYKYAIRHDICDRDYSALMKSYSVPQSTMHTSFTHEEIKELWDSVNMFPYVDEVLIGIYTGMRPQELCTLTKDQYHGTYFIAGMKTEAGRDRVIPIHPDIAPLVEARMEGDENALFLSAGAPMTYNSWRHRFDDLMKTLHMQHRPHDTRHTFITVWKEQKLDDYIREVIVGHTMKGVSDRVYTHLAPDDLYKEMALLKLKP